MGKGGRAGVGGASFPPGVQLIVGQQSLPHQSARLLPYVSAQRSLRGTLLATCRILSIFAATLIALAPMHAAAQESSSVRDRARPEYDPLGMRLGGFDLNASVDFSATRTDNLFATETNEVDDTIFHVTPRATLSSHWSRHSLSLAAGADFKTHNDFDSEDATTYYLRGDGRLDIGSNSSVFGSAGYARLVEPRTAPDASTLGEPSEYDSTNAEIGARHQFNRFAIQGAIGHREYDFENTPSRDGEDDYVVGRVEAVISPRISGFFQATADERSYESNPALSSDGLTYLAGVTLNFSELMRGQVGVGHFNRDYDSGDSTEGVAVSANLEWYVTRLSTLTFTANRIGGDSGGISNAPYVESEYGVRLDHELLRNLIVSGEYDWGRREYEIIDREDDYTTAAVEAEYLMNRRVSLFGRAEQIEVESSGLDAYRSFDANAVTLGLRLRL